jgi:hypothetical protein
MIFNPHIAKELRSAIARDAEERGRISRIAAASPNWHGKADAVAWSQPLSQLSPPKHRCAECV